ncbi:MAG: hypothetical protein PHF63_07990 [Herbinix sp.]|nr:hypothetical protein [Herbinix sp.]
MQSVDLTDLDQLDNDLKELFDKIPDRRRQLHEKIADVIKSEVDIQISRSGLNDSSGHVKAWQEQHIGSRGGYAAVRASDTSTGNNSPGAITNYLENGHRIREPSGKNKHYRPRLKKPYVDGYHFYSAARKSAESQAITAAEEYVKEIADKLEG